MLKDLSIKKKLAFGFGAIVALILILLAVAYTNFSKLSVASGWDKHTQAVLLELSAIENGMLQIQSSDRGFALSGDEAIAAPIAAGEAEVHKHLRQAITLTSDNANQQQRLPKLEPLLNEWLNEVVHPVIDARRALNKAGGSLSTSAQLSTAAEIQKGARLMASMRQILEDAGNEEKTLLEQRSRLSSQLQDTMLALLVAGGAVCVVLAAAIGFTLTRSLTIPMSNLTTALNRIAAGEQGARADVISHDELGQVTAEFNRMAQAIQDSPAKEQQATNELKAKVDALLAVVSKAASGDLTGQITITGSDAIGQLGHGLATMFDNLRTLIENVQKAGIQVTTSATEIAASAKQQEATGVEQAQTSVEVLATTKEISANTSQLLKTMEEATAVADYTTSATADAQTNLNGMNTTMQRMVSATDSISAKLAALSEKASNINSVLITITKVADQTNILSLNAAIEAEKAGEAGRGFSVVATEIRRLADQTSVSTWDIEQMLKEMQSAVSASVMGMDKFSEEIRRSVGEVGQVTTQLSGVMDQVQKLAPQFDAVLQGMQSQAVGAEQITSTMMQLNDATQQTVESLKATSEAVHQLQYAAGDLQAGVATFAVKT